MNKFALLLLFAVTGAPAVAQQAQDHASHHPVALADGEVRRVDKDAQKITVRHGPLPQFDMPEPMTMVYRVKDPAMLDQVKAGDKIRFSAEKIGGQFTLVRVEKAD